MANEAANFYDQWPARMSSAKEAAPDAVRGFAGLFQSTMTAGALTVLEKELVALGLGIALRCDPCVYAHVEKALRAGATRQQIIETAGVAVMMQGGPAYTYLPKLVGAVDAVEAR